MAKTGDRITFNFLDGSSYTGEIPKYDNREGTFTTFTYENGAIGYGYIDTSVATAELITHESWNVVPEKGKIGMGNLARFKFAMEHPKIGDQILGIGRVRIGWNIGP